MQGKTIKKIILGNNPTASVAGYLLAGIVAIQPFLVAILGRLSSNTRTMTYRRRKKEEEYTEDHPDDHPNDI